MKLAHITLSGLLLSLLALPAQAAGTLDKAKDSGRLSFGYAGDMRPYAYSEGAGQAAGYAVAVCEKVGEAIKAQLKLSALEVSYVPVTRAQAYSDLQQGKVDLLCGATPTLERRAVVDFSVPIMLSGATAAVSSNAPVRLVQALSGTASVAPRWRAPPAQAPQRVAFAVEGGGVLEKELLAQLKARRIVATVVQVENPDAGVKLLATGNVQAFFNDRALLKYAAARSERPSDIVVLDRTYRHDIVALSMRRNDEDFRLAVDRALSRLYRSPEFTSLYAKHFGAPTPAVLDFFQIVALPD